MLGPCAKYGVDEATTTHDEEEDSTHCKKERNTRDQLRTRYRRSRNHLGGRSKICMHARALSRGHLSHGLTQPRGRPEEAPAAAHKAAIRIHSFFILRDL